MIGVGLFFRKNMFKYWEYFHSTLYCCVYENTHQLMNAGPVTLQHSSLNCSTSDPAAAILGDGF